MTDTDTERMTATPNSLDKIVNWIGDRILARDRLRPGCAPLTAGRNVYPPSLSPMPLPIKKLRMGHEVFLHARRHSNRYAAGILAEDHCFGAEPKLRVFGLVAEPTNELGLWDVEVS